MNNLYRFGISLEKKLIEEFDAEINRCGYDNRSEAIRDLIREFLIKKQWQENENVAGALSMTYDHHKRELVSTLMDIQHDYHDCIVSTQHIHLDHHYCLEILAVRGKAQKVQTLSNKIRSLVGVKHVTLHMSTIGNV